MYPVSLGFPEAERRMAALTANGHHAEALITAVFTLEKTLRRSMRFFAVKRGFTSAQSATLFAGMGFKNLKDLWPCFAPTNEPLSTYIGNRHWQHVPEAITMRNRLVHGERVYSMKDCEAYAEHVLEALRQLQIRLSVDVGFDGWSRLPVRRKPALPWLA